MHKTDPLFYDGQSSTAYLATIRLETYFWIIEYKDSDLTEHTVRWEINLIHKPEITHSRCLIRYGTFPYQTLEIPDRNFLDVLKQKYPQAPFVVSNRLQNLSGWKNLFVVTSILIILLLSVYFFVIPSAAEFLAGQIPQSAEISLGKSMLGNFVSDDEKEEKSGKLLNEFARQINFNTTYPIDIIVVKKDEVNAFALPGGKIVVFDKILKQMKSSGELAALLSHEVAHAKYKHSLKSIARSLSGYIFISLIFNDINGITAMLADNANMLNNLSYSRSLELQADNSALTTLQANHIDQQGMVNLFKTLETKDDSDYLKFLSTHPLTKDRISNAKSRAAKQAPVERNKNLDQIWQKIKGQLDKS